MSGRKAALSAVKRKFIDTAGSASANYIKRIAIEQAKKVASRLVDKAKNFAGVGKYTATTTSKYNRRTSLPRGRRIQKNPKKIKAINSKLPKGVSKKFHRKVTKSVNFTANWGLYIATNLVRLRQDVVDTKNMVYTDERTVSMIFASPFELLHAASVLFNQKTDTSAWTTTTGNLDDRIKLNIISYYVTWFFKSTSSHVVNIEMFECTPKDDIQSTAINAQNFVNNSYADMQSTWTLPTGSSVASAEDINSVPAEWVELHRAFNVKRTVYKLQPGDYTSCSTKIMGNRTVDLSKYSENGTVLFMGKYLSKQVFFRVLNDPTVSTTSAGTPTAGTDAGKIHFWPSNTIGGVACTFTKHIKMAALPNPTGSNTNNLMANSIKRSFWVSSIVDALDQQVVLQNPITSTNSGV